MKYAELQAVTNKDGGNSGSCSTPHWSDQVTIAGAPDAQADRKTDSQTDCQTGRQAGRQADRQPKAATETYSVPLSKPVAQHCVCGMPYLSGSCTQYLLQPIRQAVLPHDHAQRPLLSHKNEIYIQVFLALGMFRHAVSIMVSPIVPSGSN